MSHGSTIGISHHNSGHYMLMGGMVFQNSHQATLLFPGWSTDEGFGYAWMIVICFVAGVVAVVFKYLRNEMDLWLYAMTERRKYERVNERLLIYAFANSCRAIAVFVILTLDYFLMLGAMTYNVGIFFSIVSGVASGFLFMGHLFVSHKSAFLSTSSGNPTCSYPQRVDVACSPQLTDRSGSSPPSGAALLLAFEGSNCPCSI